MWQESLWLTSPVNLHKALIYLAHLFLPCQSVLWSYSQTQILFSVEFPWIKVSINHMGVFMFVVCVSCSLMWFVCVLFPKDFREAVSKASRQAGKPVIEERLLNQILYNLPQLYELNQDLLRELEQRVHKWYMNEHTNCALFVAMTIVHLRFFFSLSLSLSLHEVIGWFDS